MNNKKKSMDVKTLVGLALLTAVVVVLQLLGAFIRFGTFSVSLVLVPIVIGAALYGPWAGCWLGFVFGFVVILQPDTGFFLSFNPVATIALCLVKGAAAGFCAGIVYKLLKKANQYVAVVAAAIICPVVNSGLFFLGCLAFFVPKIEELSGVGNALNFVLLTMIGGNFLFELLVNIVLSPAILRIINIGKKQISKRV